MAMKCGICQRNRMAKRAKPPASTAFVTAVHPISGGSAPGTAPTSMAAEVRDLSGVYTST